jgi:endonuclease-3
VSIWNHVLTFNPQAILFGRRPGIKDYGSVGEGVAARLGYPRGADRSLKMASGKRIADSTASGVDPALRRYARRVCLGLRKEYGEATCALIHRNAFELLVATILSAQCTDKKVNEVTPELFRRYPDAERLSKAVPAELERLIRPTGFFRAKSRSLIGMAQALVAEYGGEIPRDLDAMTRLPGVGRKTANVVLGTAFGIASGVVVDTHVKRLCLRLGLTKATEPEKVERDLAAILPRREWVAFSHRMIAHGRAVCLAQRPRCAMCALEKICPKVGVPRNAAG